MNGRETFQYFFRFSRKENESSLIRFDTVDLLLNDLCSIINHILLTHSLALSLNSFACLVIVISFILFFWCNRHQASNPSCCSIHLDVIITVSFGHERFFSFSPLSTVNVTISKFYGFSTQRFSMTNCLIVNTINNSCCCPSFWVYQKLSYVIFFQIKSFKNWFSGWDNLGKSWFN